MEKLPCLADLKAERDVDNTRATLVGALVVRGAQLDELYKQFMERFSEHSLKMMGGVEYMSTLETRDTFLRIADVPCASSFMESLGITGDVRAQVDVDYLFGQADDLQKPTPTQYLSPEDGSHPF